MRKLTVPLIFLTLLLLSSCSFSTSKESNESTTKGTNKIGATASNDNTHNAIVNMDDQKIKEKIAKLTSEEKVGQLLIAGVDGYSLNNTNKNYIDHYKLGGAIIMGGNVSNVKQLHSLVGEIKKANQKNKIPLFISVDEEGGRVSRMPKELLHIPSSYVIGKKNSKELSENIGNLLAEELHSFGFNMNFAPVLDINSNPKNKVIGDRAFSNKASIVSKLGIQTMIGLRQRGIIPVVKHFPGHGDTLMDSHNDLPVVNKSISQLEKMELLPFKEAIYNETDAIMVAHILMKKLDPKNPSSLSKKVMTNLLRKKLGYNGLIVTDDLTMGAIIKHKSIGNAAVQAINAGADIVLVCHGSNNIKIVYEALLNAVKSGDISEKRLNESVLRILKVKEKYKLRDYHQPSINTNTLNQSIRTILAEIREN